MTLPTREQVLAEVDEAFFAQQPNAPKRLDPHNPAHTHLVAIWNTLFAEHVNRHADEVFAQFFPESPALDPHNPEHADLIKYWTDIRDAIRNGTPPQYNWNADPTSPSTASNPDQAGPTPTFRYTLPHVVLAGEQFPTQVADVHVTLTFTGEVTITFPHGATKAPYDMMASDWPLAAAGALWGIIDGLEVHDLGSGHPHIISPLCTGFDGSPQVLFTAPSSVAFLGDVQFGYDHDTFLGNAAVHGTVRYRLDASVEAPIAGYGIPVTDVAGWVEHWGPVIQTIGAMNLKVVLDIAANPQADGGHLEVDAAAGPH